MAAFQLRHPVTFFIQMKSSDLSLHCRLKPSARPQPRRGERQHIVLNDQPTLRRRVCTGHLERRHLPVTDLRSLGKIVQSQRATDPASLVIDDDLQQPPGDCFGCLLAWTFPSDPGAIDPLKFDIPCAAPFRVASDDMLKLFLVCPMLAVGCMRVIHSGSGLRIQAPHLLVNRITVMRRSGLKSAHTSVA
jgi:hypothetical protein